MFRLGGMAAAGAAGAVVAGAASSTPAGAADGDFLKLGQNGAPNASTQPTGLYYNSGATYQDGFFVSGSSTTARRSARSTPNRRSEGSPTRSTSVPECKGSERTAPPE